MQVIPVHTQPAVMRSQLSYKRYRTQCSTAQSGTEQPAQHRAVQHTCPGHTHTGTHKERERGTHLYLHVQQVERQESQRDLALVGQAPQLHRVPVRSGEGRSGQVSGRQTRQTDMRTANTAPTVRPPSVFSLPPCLSVSHWISASSLSTPPSLT